MFSYFYLFVYLNLKIYFIFKKIQNKKINEKGFKWKLEFKYKI